MYNTKLSELAKTIAKYNNYIVSSHTNLDGDALGSELAVFFMLKNLNKNVQIINHEKPPEIYNFLPGIEEIYYPGKNNDHGLLNNKSDVILIIVDCSNLERIGDIGVDMDKIKFIINIDHHPSNTFFGKYNYIDKGASSVGEMLFDLGQEIKCTFSKEIAITMYTAIVTDTGSFRYSNTSAKTFWVSYKLIEMGVNPSRVADYVYNNNKPSTLKLLGEALRRIKTNSSLKISWTFVTRKILKDTQADDEEVEGIVDKILSIKNVQVSVFFRETKDGPIKVSFRSKGNFNVDKFARQFGGGGHPNAAGCIIEDEINKTVEQVIKKLQSELN